jgi:hypothetical protein
MLAPDHPPQFVGELHEGPACCGRNSFWVTGDALVGWVAGAQVPPLVSTSPAGTPQANAGVFGRPGYQTVVGGGSVNEDAVPGVQLSAGYWFADRQIPGVEGGFFILGRTSTSFAVGSDGSTILARPFISPNIGAPISALVSFPGLATGGVRGELSNDPLVGANLDFVQRFLCQEHVRLDVMAGYRYLHFGDQFQMYQALTTNAAPFVPGTQLLLGDTFTGDDNFHGLDLGLRGTFLWNSFSLELLGKVAGGYMTREMTIVGSTLTIVPGAATAASPVPGGLLALPSNMGTFDTHDWACSTQLGINLGWQINDNLRLRVGYTYLVWFGVERASEQVDLVINETQLPSANVPVTSVARPAFVGVKSDLAVQTVNLGLEVRW